MQVKGCSNIEELMILATMYGGREDHFIYSSDPKRFRMYWDLPKAGIRISIRVGTVLAAAKNGMTPYPHADVFMEALESDDGREKLTQILHQIATSSPS